MVKKTYKESRQKTAVLLLRFYPGEREELLAFAKSKGYDNLSDWARTVLRAAAKMKVPQ